MNGLSVIIPSKTATNLKACVKAVRECGETCRIIIVDDGVDWNLLNGQSDELTRISGIKPFVFARNCNLGIVAAGEDDVILLNDDALLTSRGGFTLLQKSAEEHQEYGCIGATTNVTGQIMQQRQGKGLRSLHHIAFMCVLIPRRTIHRMAELANARPDLFTQNGYLDERYCIDYGVEDRDYCEMINRAGMKVGVHDFCFVDHSKLTSSFRGHPMAPGRSAQNRALFLEKFKMDNYFKFR